MLVETSRTTEVRGEVITDGYRYEVNYSLNGKELTRLHCNVNKKVSEEVETPEGKQTAEKSMRVGIMFRESGNKQISLDEGEEIAVHAAIFDQILSDVAASLTPTPVKATK